jgi:anti-sigma factor RsiW
MNREQEEQLIIRCALGEASEEDRAHLQTCSRCRGEVERTEDALRGLRSAVRQLSEIELTAANQAAPKPVRRPLIALAPGFAVILLLVFIASRFFMPSRFGTARHFPEVSTTRAIDADAVLLKQVSTDLARPVPSGMEPLLPSVSLDGSESTSQLP